MLSRLSILIFLAVFLAACTDTVPQVTPTIAPTLTPEPEDTRVAEVPTETPILQLSDTPTITVSVTASLTSTTTSTATSTSSATFTGTPEPTSTNTDTPTPTETPTATNTATDTSTPTHTATGTASATLTPSDTPTLTATNTPTATQAPSNTPTATQTSTPTVTPTPSDTPTATLTPFISATPTDTDTPTATFTPSDTPTLTPTNTATNTPTATETTIPSATATFTPSDTPTPTDTATATDTAVPTATFTPSDTPTPTETLTPTNTAIPSATFTPEVTNTAIPTATFTPSDTPTATFTPTETATVTNTAAPTATATDIPTLTNTPLPTATHTAIPTATFTPSDTPTATVTTTSTPEPTATFTDLPTETSTATLTFTPTITATSTETPTLTLPPPATFDAPRATAIQETRIALLPTATQTPVPPTSTWTPVPQPSATSTLIEPTQAAIVITVITATPGATDTFDLVDTPIVSTPVPQPNATEIALSLTIEPTATAIFTPTAVPQEWFIPNVITVAPPPVFNTGFDSGAAQAFTFNVQPGQAATFNDIPLRTDKGIRIFEPNPVFPDSFLRVDENGGLLFKMPGNPIEGEYIDAPFFDGFSAGSAADNRNFISDVEWAPNGGYFAFIVSPPPGTDNGNAGVWWWQPARETATDPSYALFRDCPAPGTPACELVSGQNAGRWTSRKIEWANDSIWILVTVSLPDEGRFGLAVVPALRDADFAKFAQPINRYDSGWWMPDGRIMVSGRRPDGQVIIAVVNRDFAGEQVLFDASANGYYVQDAVQRPNGEILFLGNPIAPGAPLRLHRLENGIPVPISDNIGGAAPSNVDWTRNRDRVVVTVGGQQFSVNASTGGISSPGTTGSLAFIPGGGSSGAVPVTTPPDGIVAGSRFTPGQQVLYLGGVCNLRSAPTTATNNAVDVVNDSEFVAMLAGPYEAEGFIWWRVGNARSVQGWSALEFCGTLNP